jgi:hypothetical protein
VVTLGVGVGVGVAVRSLSAQSSGTHESAAGPGAFPAAAPVAPFTFTFGAYQVGKLSVAAPIDVSTAYELAPVDADGLTTNDKPVDDPAADSTRDPKAGKATGTADPDLSAFLTVYRPGAHDSSTLANSQKVTVAGRPGLETTVTGGPWPMVRTLAWQYADNAWAVILSRSGGPTTRRPTSGRQLAAGLRTEARTPARLPITTSYVPAGYGLTEVGVKASPD